MLTWPSLAPWPDAQNRDELLLSCSSHSAPSGYGFVLNWQRPAPSHSPSFKPLMGAKAVYALFVLGPSTMTPLPATPLPASTPSFPFSFSTLHLSKKAPTPVGSASEKPVIAVGDVELRFGNEQRTLSTDSWAAHVRNNLLYLAFSLLLCISSSRRSKQSYPATRALQVLRESFGCTRCVGKESNMFNGSPAGSSILCRYDGRSRLCSVCGFRVEVLCIASTRRTRAKELKPIADALRENQVGLSLPI